MRSFSIKHQSSLINRVSASEAECRVFKSPRTHQIFVRLHKGIDSFCCHTKKTLVSITNKSISLTGAAITLIKNYNYRYNIFN